MSVPAAAERASLCDLFVEVGPDAPTLCGDWTTRDLAAHLIVRERRPDAAAGILAKPLANYGDHVRAEEAKRPWPELIERVRSGPPRWSPTALGPVNRAVNTVEFFVHHEDVRRASDPWVARNLDPNLAADLYASTKRMGKLLVRKAPAGITLVPTDANDWKGSTIVAKTADEGEPSVTLRAPIGELVLFIYGRQAQSLVELDGPAEAAAALRTASFGI